MAAPDPCDGPTTARRVVMVLLTYVDPACARLEDSESGCQDTPGALPWNGPRFQAFFARPKLLPGALLDACDGVCWDLCDERTCASVDHLFEALHAGVTHGWAVHSQGDRVQVPEGCMVSRIVCVTADAGGSTSVPVIQRMQQVRSAVLDLTQRCGQLRMQ